MDEDSRGPSAAWCGCCHRVGAASEGAEGPEAVEQPGYASVCTAGFTKTVRIPLGCLVWRGCGYTSQMQWMVMGMVSMNGWTDLIDDGPQPPEVERCAWCKRSGEPAGVDGAVTRKQRRNAWLALRCFDRAQAQSVKSRKSCEIKSTWPEARRAKRKWWRGRSC